MAAQDPLSSLSPGLYASGLIGACLNEQVPVACGTDYQLACAAAPIDPGPARRASRFCSYSARCAGFGAIVPPQQPGTRNAVKPTNWALGPASQPPEPVTSTRRRRCPPLVLKHTTVVPMTGHQQSSALRALVALLPELDEVLVTLSDFPTRAAALTDRGSVSPDRDTVYPNPRPHAA